MASQQMQSFRSRRDLSTLVNNPDPEVPKNVNADIWQVYQSQHNVMQSSGETFQIISQPDCRFPLIAWIYSISTIFSQTSYRDDAYASPPSVLAYTFLLYYAMMYFVDIYLSPFPSHEAQRIQNQQQYQMLLENLLTLPVPSFADEWFLKLQPFQDSLARNLHFLSTLGTDDPDYDFGRIFPLVSFLQLHNVLATSPANLPLPDLLQRFYFTIVCRFGNANFTNGQLYGAIRDDPTDQGTTQRYRNWLNERLEQLISSASVRTLMSRVAYGSFTIAPPSYRDPDDYSVYDFTLSLSSINFSQHMQLINHIGPFIRHNFPRSKNLANYISYGTPSIIRHLIFGPTLPTWHTLAAPDPSSNRTFPANSRTPEEFAADIQFMVNKPDPTAGNTPVPQQEQIVLPAAVPQGDQRPLLRIAQVFDDSHPTAPHDIEPDEWTEFQMRKHYQPQAIIFDPADSNPAAHGITCLGGHLIERGELCGIGLNLPYASSNLLHVNTLFCDGAILRSKTRKATTAPFSTTTPERIDYNFSPLAFFLKTMSYIRIPFFRTGLIETSTRPAGNPARLLPSHGIIPPGQQENRYTRRVIDSYTAVASQTQTDTLIDDGSIYLWSSYRVVLRKLNTFEDRVYYLPSLSHLYGQRTRSMVTNFPSLLIP